MIATLVGHAHTACATTFAGRPLLVGGGCASTVPLDAEPYPVVWEAGPPTLAFHLLHDDGRLTTHWRALPFPGGADAAHLRHRHPAGHASPCTTATDVVLRAGLRAADSSTASSSRR